MWFCKNKSSVNKGQKGEKLAIAFLKKNGFEILERNFKFKRFEVDIIAKKEERLSFIEVKMEKISSAYRADLKVDKSKREKIIKTARYYLTAIYKKEINYKFDILRVIEEGTSYEIKHLENAFNELGEKNIIF